MLLYASQSLSHFISSLMTFLDVVTSDDIDDVVVSVFNTRCNHSKLYNFEDLKSASFRITFKNFFIQSMNLLCILFLICWHWTFYLFKNKIRPIECYWTNFSPPIKICSITTIIASFPHWYLDFSFLT